MVVFRFTNLQGKNGFSEFFSKKNSVLEELKPHCIRCCHFKVDDVTALEAISKPPVRIVEDNVTASLH
jgi:hypothetical protein